jgi:hypothetical protein
MKMIEKSLLEIESAEQQQGHSDSGEQYGPWAFSEVHYRWHI